MDGWKNQKPRDPGAADPLKVLTPGNPQADVLFATRNHINGVLFSGGVLFNSRLKSRA